MLAVVEGVLDSWMIDLVVEKDVVGMKNSVLLTGYDIVVMVVESVPHRLLGAKLGDKMVPIETMKGREGP